MLAAPVAPLPVMDPANGRDLKGGVASIKRHSFDDVAVSSERVLNAQSALRKRDLGVPLSRTHRQKLVSQFIPNRMVRLCYDNCRQYEGRFSHTGNTFMLAGSNATAALYDVNASMQRIHQSSVKVDCEHDEGPFAKPFKTIQCKSHAPRTVDFSSDEKWVAYAGWSDSIYLCNVFGDYEMHDEIRINSTFTRGWWGFCLFSVRFSPDSLSLIGGCNDSGIFVVNLERRSCTRISAHDDDVNAVAFLDDDTNYGSQIILSGSDDDLVKMWDLRDPTSEVAVLKGHNGGITSVESRGDGRYVISNAKDSQLKLWDLRYLSKTSRGACVQTYRDHHVSRTLVRCGFSPERTTGKRFIYTGCASGGAVIYDMFSGETVRKLNGHKGVVRDVSWHPELPLLATTSWDGCVGVWDYVSESLQGEGKKKQAACAF